MSSSEGNTQERRNKENRMDSKKRKFEGDAAGKITSFFSKDPTKTKKVKQKSELEMLIDRATQKTPQCGLNSIRPSTPPPPPRSLNQEVAKAATKEKETTPKKRDSLSGVMAKRSVASRDSRFDSADFVLEQKGEVPTRKPPAKPSLEDIVGEKNNQEEKEEEKKNNNNQQDQKSLAKTITEHLKSTEYLEWAEPDSPDKRKEMKKQRRGTLEALADLGVSFNADDSFAGPKTSRVREEEEKKKKKSRWNFFKRKKDS